MNKGTLFLTSAGLSSPNIAEKFKSMALNPESQAVAIITTASEGKENNKYSQAAKGQFVEMGFKTIDFVDLEAEPDRDLSSYGILYVCGGNTFKLLKFARQANFKAAVEELLKRGGIYIGVSAGSIIIGPSIRIAGEIEPDPNDVGLEDLTGLCITDLIVLPHYSPELEAETKAFEARYSVKVERLTNSQALLLQDGFASVLE